MQIETLLPLGKVAPGLREPPTPLDLGTIYDSAVRDLIVGTAT